MRLAFTEHHLIVLLSRYENQSLPLDLFMNEYFRAHTALGSKDRKFIAEQSYGMIKHLSLLNHLLGPHASWIDRLKLHKHFVAQAHQSDLTIAPHIRACLPEALFNKIANQEGPDYALQFGLICNSQAPVCLRANLLKTTVESLQEKLHAFTPERTPFSPMGLVLPSREALFSLAEFKEGLFEMQDEASQLVCLQLRAKSGDLVLDYCAGSGGKTLGFAHLLKGRGQIYLHDIRKEVLQQAKKRLKRAGIQNAQCLEPNHCYLQQLERRLDWVIVDAPCSGTGTLRRNPDLKWKFSEKMLEELLLKQRTIFEKALTFVKPQGSILWATCSVLEDENENQIDYFISKYGLKLKGEPFKSKPTLGGMDGFFAATLEKEPI